MTADSGAVRARGLGTGRRHADPRPAARRHRAMPAVAAAEAATAEDVLTLGEGPRTHPAEQTQFCHFPLPDHGVAGGHTLICQCHPRARPRPPIHTQKGRASGRAPRTQSCRRAGPRAQDWRDSGMCARFPPTCRCLSLFGCCRVCQHQEVPTGLFLLHLLMSGPPRLQFARCDLVPQDSDFESANRVSRTRQSGRRQAT